ncbi:MAG: DNA polymerase/3'-5' exonuclease PolX [Candidatus Curtissbacteria bacterium]|nr:DNA polymerase/3'-5' exonuclease PolX [Candidatus Curtissbacteria bacterium]
MKYFTNTQIADLFREISATYAVGGKDYFKQIAYENAATSVEHATSELKDLWDDNKLDTIPGIGKTMQAHLDELFKTGKVKHFEEITKEIPPGMFALLKIPGIGPKTAYKIAKELKVKDINDLLQKAKAGQIKEIPGFGARSEEDIIAGIGAFKARSGRYTLPEAYTAAQRVIAYLKAEKECQDAQPLGSLRRMVATVGDIDIAVSSKEPAKIISHFGKFREISRILTAGGLASSVVLNSGIQVDVKVQPPEAFGALLQHFTGSKNHNIHLRELALKKNYSLSEHGIKVENKTKNFHSEKDFYGFLGLDYIEPELREDTGEIEAAQKHQLPNLVTLKDIKGDIHLHSNYPIEPSHDLGKDNFEEIIKKAKNMGYQYIGLSDHSPGFSTHTKEQILSLIAKRTKKIEHIKSSHKNFGILNLLEIDILTNSELSVPEEGLKMLDGAIAGIHSSHKQDKQAITKRLLTACHSPYVQVISHPTGRLLPERESYEVDWPQIFAACVKTKTMLEINAWPNRLDLPDVLVREAIVKGVTLMISSDAHQIDQMDNMRFGVAVARRGWCEKKSIANTLPWLEFKKLFEYHN